VITKDDILNKNKLLPQEYWDYFYTRNKKPHYYRRLVANKFSDGLTSQGFFSNCNVIIDFACGHGELLSALYRKLGSNIKYIGVDFNSNVLRNKIMYPHINFFRIDLEKLQDKKWNSDVSICKNALGFINDKVAFINCLIRNTNNYIIFTNYGKEGYEWLLNTPTKKTPAWAKTMDYDKLLSNQEIEESCNVKINNVKGIDKKYSLYYIDCRKEIKK